ncbi:MAG TPA: aminotransferase [Acidimicrobiaceae bacterium]|nr:aminotransferase [Acidimicrobiaceae bacterium]|tara:strand:+ start:842 stop:1546 length:705 start_codon:yes stop_codon:yes gene_type:complete
MGLALIIEHDETGPVAVVGERLIHHGFELDTFRVLEDRSDPICTKEFPDPNVYDLVVVLGSERSVCDKGPIESWIDREIDLVQTAHRSGKPVLGLCFGGQVLAAALGGEVTKLEKPEIGWCEIESEHPEVVSPGPWFEWHYDQFTVPEGSIEMARSEASSQVFRLGNSVGTQFHPEITPEIIASWTMIGGDELAKFDISPDSIISESVDREAEARQQAYRLVDWFLDLPDDQCP